jgi:hypothetical protein
MSFVAVVSASCLPGADQPEPSQDSPDSHSDVITNDETEVPTQSPHLLPLWGYNEVSHNMSGIPCIEVDLEETNKFMAGQAGDPLPAAAKGTAIKEVKENPENKQPTPETPDVVHVSPENGLRHIGVDGVRSTMTLKSISNTSELADSIGADADFGADFKVIKIGGKAHFLNERRVSKGAFYILLKLSTKYNVRNYGIPKLRTAKQFKPEWIKNSQDTTNWKPERFLATCGHVYINTIERGAHLYVLYEFETSDDKKKQEIATAFDATLKGVGGADPQTKLELKKATEAALKGVKVNVQVVASGYTHDGVDIEKQLPKLKSLLSDFDPDQFNGCVAAMIQSVIKDRKAEDENFYGTRKNVSVINEGLYGKFYTGILPADFDAGEAGKQIGKKLRDFEKSMRELMLLQSRVSSRLEEVNKVLDGIDTDDYNVAPPGQFMTSIGGAQDRVRQYQERFDAGKGGSEAQRLTDFIKECWSNVGEAGDFTSCAKWNDDKKQNRVGPDFPLWRDLHDLMDKYDSKDRIVRLVARTFGESASARVILDREKGTVDQRKFPDAAKMCESLHMRLPTWDEAQRMILTLKHHLQASIWLKGPPYSGRDGKPLTTLCTNGWYAKYDGDKDGLTTECEREGKTLPFICVHAGGLKSLAY